MYGRKRKSNNFATPPAKVSKPIIKKEPGGNDTLRKVPPPKVPVKIEKVKIEKPDEFFTCDACNATFVTQLSLTRHMVLHDDLPKFPCTFCKKIFYKKEKLTSHVNADHEGGKFVCKYCNRNMTRRDLLLRHITNFHPEHLLEAMQNEEKEIKEESQKLQKIPQPIPEKAKVPIQKKVQVPNRASTSTSITKPVKQLPIIQPQFQNHHNNGSPLENQNYYGETTDFSNGDYYEDDGAEDEIDDIVRINASLNGIRVERKHQCQECGVSFMSLVNLQRHAVSHNLDRPHKCPMCGKGFVRKEHLTKHLASVHSGVKYTCEFCNKDISRKDHLIRHIRNVHPQEYLGIPPEIVENQDLDLSPGALQASGYVISERALRSMQPKPKKSYLSCDMCDLSFQTINDLHEHQGEVHSDVRKFRCDFCPKAFKRKEHLTKHIVLHTGEKNFCCDNCGKEFPRKDALQDHIKRVHGIDFTSAAEFPCNFCEKVFLQKSNLIRHMRNAHELLIDLDDNDEVDELELDDGSLDQPNNGHNNGFGIANYPMISNFVVSPTQSTSSSFVINPVINPINHVAYNLNGSQNVSFREDVNLMQNNLEKFSCAHCPAFFNDQKQFLTHLNSHRRR